MNLEDLARMSEADLRAKANEKLAKLDIKVEGYPLDEGPVLSEAQFFIDEIERRKQARTGHRDFYLEIVVIVLIGIEIVVGLIGGGQQLDALEKMNTSAGKQLDVLQKLNTSADDTAKVMRLLRDEQDAALTAQQQTLQLIGQMNGALQTQLGLDFAPALTLTYEQSSKMFVLTNFGKTNISIWGMRLGDEKKAINPEPRVIVPGPTFSYKWPADFFLTPEAIKLPKGSTETVTCEAYLKTANGKKYTATYRVMPLWKNDELMLNIQPVDFKPDNW